MVATSRYQFPLSASRVYLLDAESDGYEFTLLSACTVFAHVYMLVPGVVSAAGDVIVPLRTHTVTGFRCAMLMLTLYFLMAATKN